MDTQLSGKRALVCGSSGGIGLATARELARHGADITLLARSEATLKANAVAIRSEFNVDCDSIALNLNKSHVLEHQLKERCKTTTYHILVNNSGGPPHGGILDMEDAAFIDYFKNHVIANQTLVKALLPGMQKAEYGRVINIISTSVKQPIPGLGASNTIRGAVASWAKTLSREVGPFVTVNNILPGFTMTERLVDLADSVAARRGITRDDVFTEWKATIPVNRFADPKETAYAIRFLASPEAAYINGINLPVDGGRLMTL